MAFFSPVLAAILAITVLGVQAQDQAPVDCQQALFQQAGVRSSHINEYVLAFRRNGLGQDILYDLDFVQLCKLLEGEALNITHAGDVDKIHQCVSNRGPCVVQPFCLNSGSCAYREATADHACECTTGFRGVTCEVKNSGGLREAEEDILRLSTAVANVGTTYTRWGKRSCNETAGSETVYSGSIAGEFYNFIGGASNYLCLPLSPEYGSVQSGNTYEARVYGAELETSGTLLSHLHNENPTCSVCHASGRSSQIMLPARTTCPPSWTQEYGGYLMSAHHGHRRTEYICVDSSPDVLSGESGNTDGALLYFVEAGCNYGLKCPPYDTNKELTCVVCSR